MKQRLIDLSVISVGILSFIILIFCFFEYVFPVALPFLLAFLVATLTVRPARRLSKSIKAPERIIRLVMSVVITLIFISVAGFTIWRTTNALWHFLLDISEKNRLYDLLELILSKDIPLLGGILPDQLASQISQAFGSLLSSGLSAIAEWAGALAGGVPQFFFFLLVTLISLVYFSLDYDKITGFVKSYLPNKLTTFLLKLRNGVIFVLKKYILSYSLIMLITYLVLLLGFLLLRVEHAMLVAFFIALLDILPVIGVGTVLVPWSIYELAVGDGRLGVGLIILFVVNSVIRQFSEPKIVGKSLNIHPLFTLILLYVGYALFGIFGMLALPVLAVCIGAALKGDNAAEVG